MNDKSLLVSDKQRREICVTIRAMEKGFDLMREPSGKIVLATGSTKGTGKTIAERLQRAGTEVIMTAKNAPKNFNEQFNFIAEDLSKAKGIEKVVQEVLSTSSKLDILINNVGGSKGVFLFIIQHLSTQIVATLFVYRNFSYVLTF